MLDWIFANCGPPANFLVFGEPDPEIELALLEVGWHGLAIRPRTYLEYPGKWQPCPLNQVVGQIGPDSHFVPCMYEGVYVRAFTTAEITAQFLHGKQWSVVILNTEDQNRMIWSYLKEVLGGTRIWIMPEDGHNEEVSEWAWTAGYHQHIKVYKDQEVFVLQGAGI